MLDHIPAQFKDKLAVHNYDSKHGFRFLSQTRTIISPTFGLFPSHHLDKCQYKAQKSSFTATFFIFKLCGYSFQCQKDAGGCAVLSQQNFRNIYKDSVHKIISIKLDAKPDSGIATQPCMDHRCDLTIRFEE